MAWTIEGRAHGTWTADGGAAGGWTNEARVYGDWLTEITTEVIRITEAGSVRITEQGETRIIERFGSVHWLLETLTVNPWRKE